MDPTLPICDPHLHFWDATTRTNANIAGATAVIPTYLPADYTADAAGLNLVSGVHVETAVGQAPGGEPVDFLGESEWLNTLGIPFPYRIVAYVHLARDDTEAVLRAQAAIPNVVGIRMIMNHHATNPALTWPQVEHGNYFDATADPDAHARLRRGFGLLAELGMSFDLHLNPHQMVAAAAFVAEFPTVPVVIDHLGCPKMGADGDTDAAALAVWTEGMKLFAKLPHVHVKLSMAPFILEDVFTNAASEARVKAMFLSVIEWFGPKRCMFASNFPVDKLSGVALAAMYGKFYEWVADFPRATQEDLFHNTAQAVYKVAK